MLKGSKGVKNPYVIFSVIVILIIALSMAGVRMYQRFESSQSAQGKTYSPDGNEADEITMPESRSVEESSDIDKLRNYLVVGLDESESLTDVIMVVSVDETAKTAHILQIPRDSYVSDDLPTGKINSVYSFGDESLKPIERLEKTIYEMFALEIDNYIAVNLSAFKDAVDAVGGIPVNMPYEIVYDPSKIIPAGESILSGEQAEWLVRHRSSYKSGDIGRVMAQRIFLASAIRRVKSLGAVSLAVKVLPAVYGELSTDLSISRIIELYSVMKDTTEENITMHLLPGEGYQNGSQAVWSVHKQETADLLNEYFRENIQVPADELNIVELANTGNWYNNTNQGMNEILQ